MLQRYVVHEEELLRKHSDDDTSDDEEGAVDASVMRLDAFARLRHEAYSTAVIIVLGGVLDFTPGQFDAEREWLTPFLSRLVVCESLEVRLCVREIYRIFVNPIILQPR